MQGVRGIRPIKFDELWDIYLKLPEEGDRNSYLRYLENIYGRKRKARETFNTLVFVGVLQGSSKFRKVAVKDRSELRELMVKSVFDYLSLRDGLLTEMPAGLSERSKRAITSILRNLGAAIPVRALRLSSECDSSLASYISSLGGRAKVKEVKEWALSKGFSDPYFRKCLISAMVKGIVMPPRKGLFDLWSSKGLEEPPVSIRVDDLSEEEMEALRNSEGLVSFDFQRGKEVVTIYSLWDDEDELVIP